MRRFLPEPEPWTARWALRLAVAGWLVAALGLLATRGFGRPPATGLAVSGAGLLLAIVGAVLAGAAFVSIWRSGAPGLGRAAAGLLLSACLLAWPAFLLGRAVALPLVNDVTTDPDDPPSFGRSRAALEARGGMQPPEGLGGDGTAGASYGDLQPVLLEVTAAEAFEAARKTVAALGWRVVEQVPPGGRTGTGRIDAVATSALYRFADDITIRIRPSAGETRVDIRSRSRVGRHDLGANAARIRAFAAELRAQESAR
jgi:uncharacterized protein (DUF1499 family)